MKIYLHIGTHKTGTTVLQQYLFHNYDALKSLGWLYPKAGIPKGLFGHHLISWNFSRNTPFSFNEFESELNESECNNVIVSSEDFSTIKFPKKVADLFRKFQVEVVVYFRRQDEYLLSSYNEVVKKGSYASSFSSFIEMFNKQGRLDYFGLCERWSEAFGKDQIRARIYKKSSSIVNLFMEHIELPLSNFVDPAAVRKNESVDPRLIGSMRILNKIKKSDKKLDIYNDLLRVARNTKLPVQDNTQYSLFSINDREELMRLYRESNEKLSTKYLNGDKFSELLIDQKTRKISDNYIDPTAFKEILQRLIAKLTN